MAQGVSRKAVVAVLVSGVAMAVLMLGRSYPWQLALPVAIAFGLLAYSTYATIERLTAERNRYSRLFEDGESEDGGALEDGNDLQDRSRQEGQE